MLVGGDGLLPIEGRFMRLCLLARLKQASPHFIWWEESWRVGRPKVAGCGWRRVERQAALIRVLRIRQSGVLSRWARATRYAILAVRERLCDVICGHA